MDFGSFDFTEEPVQLGLVYEPQKGTKELRQSGGYDENFVAAPGPDYECPVCLLVLRDPILTICGHSLCNSCFRELPRRNGKVLCPVDREEIREREAHSVMPDKKTERKILELHVQCRASSAGCVKIIELRYLQDHMNTCEYALVPCPNGCLELIVRRFMDHHQTNNCPKRKQQCQYCFQMMEFQQLKLHEEKRCKKIPVLCLQCNKSMARHLLPDHCSKEPNGDCPETVIDCQYSKIGCRFQVEREKMAHHQQENMERHMLLLLENNRELKEENSVLKIKLQEMALQDLKFSEELRKQKNAIRDQKKCHEESMNRITKQMAEMRQMVTTSQYKIPRSSHVSMTNPGHTSSITPRVAGNHFSGFPRKKQEEPK